MLMLQNISHHHPDKDLLFSNINLAVNENDKIALIGNNGIGKSTLLKLISKEIKPTGGSLNISAAPYYVPQMMEQFNHLTIAQTLKIDSKLNALKEILSGNATAENFIALNDDWNIEDRCEKAMEYWQLKGLDFTLKMSALSGGQKTKVFMAGIIIHQPELILLDEPSNHLDSAGRQLLCDFIEAEKRTFIVVSHDRKLLNMLHKMCELRKDGIHVYGGNYEFYEAQKQIEKNALASDIKHTEKTLRKAKDKARENLEKQQKLDSRGKGKQEKAGVARIMMNTLRNKAENSTSKLKNTHEEKLNELAEELQGLRASSPPIDKMKLNIYNSVLPKGKILCRASEINFAYKKDMLWKHNLSFEITSGERIALKGNNGSGKTTLINIILEKLKPAMGSIYFNLKKTFHLDQEYSIINNNLSVFEQAKIFAANALQEHEIKIRLARFLFDKNMWDKPCSTLSGGEKMRLILCTLTIAPQTPDIIILDEPTNNIDIQNIEILTTAINDYNGAIIVVSHDEKFLDQINITRVIEL